MKQVDGYGKPITRLDDGVYLVTVTSEGEPNKDHLMLYLTYHAASQTIKKGYDSFISMQDLREDTEMEQAIADKRMRKLVLKRIKKKSYLIEKFSTIRKVRVSRSNPEYTEL